MPKIIVAVKGGPGSGFHGHAGRQGKRGGSQAMGSVMQSQRIKHSVTDAVDFMRSQLDNIAAAAISVGRHRYGSGLSFNDGYTDFSVSNISNISKNKNLDLGDPDSEYPFVYDPRTKTGKYDSSLTTDNDCEFSSGKIRQFYANPANNGKLYMTYLGAEGIALLWVDDPSTKGGAYIGGQEFGPLAKKASLLFSKPLKEKIYKPRPKPHIEDPDYLRRLISESRSQVRSRRSKLKDVATDILSNFVENLDLDVWSDRLYVEQHGAPSEEGIDRAIRYARELRDRNMPNNRLDEIVRYIAGKIKT